MGLPWSDAHGRVDLANRGLPVDRAGGGVVVEAYPAAALMIWGLPFRGYKGSALRPQLNELVTALLRAAPWLDLGDFGHRCRTSDHALDAVIDRTPGYVGSGS